MLSSRLNRRLRKSIQLYKLTVSMFHHNFIITIIIWAGKKLLLNFLVCTFQLKKFLQSQGYWLESMYVMILKYRGLMLSMGFLRTELSFKKLRVTGMTLISVNFLMSSFFCMWGLVKEMVVNTILHDSVLKNV